MGTQGRSLVSQEDQINQERSLCGAVMLVSAAERDRSCVGYPGLITSVRTQPQRSGQAPGLCLFRLDLKHSLARPFSISNISSEVTHSVHSWCVFTANVLCLRFDLWLLSHQDNVLDFVCRPAWLTDL